MRVASREKPPEFDRICVYDIFTFPPQREKPTVDQQQLQQQMSQFQFSFERRTRIWLCICVPPPTHIHTHSQFFTHTVDPASESAQEVYVLYQSSEALLLHLLLLSFRIVFFFVRLACWNMCSCALTDGGQRNKSVNRSGATKLISRTKRSHCQHK